MRGTRLPDNDRLWLSVGATYNWNERLALELAYSHIFVDDAPITLGPRQPDLQCRRSGPSSAPRNAQVDIISFALRYKFGPTAAPPRRR